MTVVYSFGLDIWILTTETIHIWVQKLSSLFCLRSILRTSWLLVEHYISFVVQLLLKNLAVMFLFQVTLDHGFDRVWAIDSITNARSLKLNHKLSKHFIESVEQCTTLCIKNQLEIRWLNPLVISSGLSSQSKIQSCLLQLTLNSIYMWSSSQRQSLQVEESLSSLTSQSTLLFSFCGNTAKQAYQFSVRTAHWWLRG